MSDKRVLAISAIVLVAVIMGMSAMTPALAERTPPARSPGDEHVPTVDECAAIDALEGISEAARADLKDKAGCD